MNSSEDEILLDKLRAILLEEDPSDEEGMHKRFAEVRQLLDNPAFQKELLAPHMEEQIENLRNNFAGYFAPQLTESLKQQIVDSRETVIEALYPIVGKLIKKYLQAELAAIVANVDSKVSNTFSFDKFKKKIVGIFTGVNEKELALKELNAAKVEEVFVIQKDSGLLLGSFSRNDTVDRDMIAGMMTAIKSFVEDAFKQSSDELQTIQYGSFNIYLHSFYSHYMAVAVSGIADPVFKERLGDSCLEYAERYMSIPVKNADSGAQERISNSLKEHFNDFK